MVVTIHLFAKSMGKIWAEAEEVISQTSIVESIDSE